MVNTSVQEGEAPKQHTQHGGEGGAPHRAEAFVAMKSSEERCQAVTPHHAEHDNRAVASTTRYPEGGTSRALSGPEGTRGHTKGAGRAGAKKQEESKPSRPNPTNAEQNRATKGKQQQDHHGQQNPKTKPKQKGKRHGPPKENQSRPKRARRTLQSPTYHQKKPTKKEHPREQEAERSVVRRPDEKRSR